jgi:cytidine deaminase
MEGVEAGGSMHPQDRIVQELRAAAAAVAERAYCPYSHFPVGAAVLTEAEEIFVGCNVENASYGLTICAERSAICQAVAHGARTIRAIAIATPTEVPTPPCGACRQTIHEFGPGAIVFSFGRDDAAVVHTLSELLPGAFGRCPGHPQENAGHASA